MKAEVVYMLSLLISFNLMNAFFQPLWQQKKSAVSRRRLPEVDVP
jgi:hypothetical protein